MRASLRHLLLIAATVLVAGACASPSDDADAAPATGASSAHAVPAGHSDQRAEVALCSVLPHRMVGQLVGTGSVDAVGEGPHCTWRLLAPTPTGAAGADLASHATLQGTFLDARAYEAGRPPVDDPSIAAVDEVTSVGDEAFLVRLDQPGPTTLYVRDGDRTLSLWLDDVAMPPQEAERSLARTATLLLRLA